MPFRFVTASSPTPRPRGRSVASRMCAAWLCVLVALAAVPIGDAVAGEGRFRRPPAPRGGGQMEARAARQAERMQQMQQQRASRAASMREAAPAKLPDVAPAAAAPPSEGPAVDRVPARPGRLTPDERRALRQQINEAGRDVYRPTRP